jgi:microsomal dipeptidase-like Zn-dependent dipeptidase
MPSFDSAWTLKAVSGEAKGTAKVYQKILDFNRKVGNGFSILKGGLEGSELTPETKEIISLIAKKGAILSTSHLSPKESLILAKEAKKAGLERVVVTHVNSDIIGASIEEQKELARHGAYLEYSFAVCLPSAFRESQPIQKIAQMMNAVGPEQCVLGTDLGRFNYPQPVEGLRMFIAGLLLGGMEEKDIEKMAKVNPSYLLGL